MNLNPLSALRALAGRDQPVSLSGSIPQEIYESLREVEPEAIETIMGVMGHLEQFNNEVQASCQEFSGEDRYLTIERKFSAINQGVERMIKSQESDKAPNRFMNMLKRVMPAKEGENIAKEFMDIQREAIEVVQSCDKQVRQERGVVGRYSEVRRAVRETLKISSQMRDRQAARLQTAAEALSVAQIAAQGADPATTEGLDLRMAFDDARDAHLKEDERYQIAENLFNNMTASHHTSDIIFAHLTQASDVKRQVYSQLGTMLQTQQGTYTALIQALSTQQGLNQGTRTLQALRDGTNNGVTTLARVGGKLHTRSIAQAYAPTIDPNAVRELMTSVLQNHKTALPLMMNARAEANKASQSIAQLSHDFQDSLAKSIADAARQRLAAGARAIAAPVAAAGSAAALTHDSAAVEVPGLGGSLADRIAVERPRDDVIEGVVVAPRTPGSP